MDRVVVGAGYASVAYPRRFAFMDDFPVSNTNTSPGAGAVVIYDRPWWGIGTVNNNTAEIGGSVQLVGDATRAPQLFTSLGTSTPNSFVSASKRPLFKCKAAQSGAGAATRKFGLASTGGTGDPTDGIYIRHTAAGNLILVCRDSNSETPLDTGLPAADGVFHEIAIAITSTKVDVYVDGVYKGSITTNIPAAMMGIHFTSSATTANGLEIEYVYLEQDR